MKHLGLFEGIGGFSLAAQWMGWETVAWVEINKFCQQVLRKHFPHAEGYTDIKTFNGTKYRGTIDIITGGFPCQPYSVAGKRKGKEDDRHLWPEMLRVIREVQPKWVVAENVSGLVNWEGGLVFEEVHTDLEADGYEVQSFILPACAVNAPHRRDRAWIIAHSHSNAVSYNTGEIQSSSNEIETKAQRPHGEWVWPKPSSISFKRIFTNTISNRLQRQSKNSKSDTKITEKFKRSPLTRTPNIDRWCKFPTQSPFRIGDDGISTRMVRFAIESGGNAIVPQVAFEIFKAIEHINENLLNK